MEITSNNQAYSTGLYSKNEPNEKTEDKKDSTFQALIKNNNDEKKEEENEKTTEETKRTTEELVNDIISLLKTGMTVGEVEAIQELLRDLKDKIKEGDYSEKEIERMLSNIEKEIQALQKKVSGQVIIKADDNSALENKNSDESLSSVEVDFLSRIDEAMTNLENLKSGKDKKESSLPTPNESELLEMIKNFKN